MKIRYLMTCFLIILAFIECKQPQIIKKAKPENVKSTVDEQLQDRALMDSLTSRIETGDTLAYNQVKAMYYVGHKKTDFLYYALMMSNNYDYDQASFDVFSIIKTTSKPPLDTISQKMINSYLLRSHRTPDGTRK